MEFYPHSEVDALEKQENELYDNQLNQIIPMTILACLHQNLTFLVFTPLWFLYQILKLSLTSFQLSLINSLFFAWLVLLCLFLFCLSKFLYSYQQIKVNSTSIMGRRLLFNRRKRNYVLSFKDIESFEMIPLTTKFGHIVIYFKEEAKIDPLRLEYINHLPAVYHKLNCLLKK